jgi:hypothetical protein
MRAFTLYVNGRKLATAGIGSDGVLAAAVTWVGHVKRGAGTKRAIARDEVDVRLGGLDSVQTNISTGATRGSVWETRSASR